MTEDTTTTTAVTTPVPRVTIDDLARTAVTTPETLSHADIARLGTWIVDHEAHILAHNRLVAGTAGNALNRDVVAERRAARAASLPVGTDTTGPLTQRLAPSDPTKQIEGTTVETPTTTETTS